LNPPTGKEFDSNAISLSSPWPLAVSAMVVTVVGIAGQASVLVALSLGMVVMMVMAAVHGPMAVPVVMVMVVPGIRAHQRLEGRDDMNHGGAEPFQHRLDGVVPQDQDAVLRYRRRQVPAADMPAQLGQVDGAERPDLEKLLGGRLDLDMSAIVEDQAIACPQSRRFDEIDEDAAAVLERQRLAAQPPLVMGELHDTRRLFFSGAARHYPARARKLREIGVRGEFHARAAIER